jgi:hypothetical protein
MWIHSFKFRWFSVCFILIALDPTLSAVSPLYGYSSEAPVFQFSAIPPPSDPWNNTHVLVVYDSDFTLSWSRGPYQGSPSASSLYTSMIGQYLVSDITWTKGPARPRTLWGAIDGQFYPPTGIPGILSLDPSTGIPRDFVMETPNGLGGFSIIPTPSFCSALTSDHTDTLWCLLVISAGPCGGNRYLISVDKETGLPGFVGGPLLDSSITDPVSGLAWSPDDSQLYLLTSGSGTCIGVITSAAEPILYTTSLAAPGNSTMIGSLVGLSPSTIVTGMDIDEDGELYIGTSSNDILHVDLNSLEVDLVAVGDPTTVFMNGVAFKPAN